MSFIVWRQNLRDILKISPLVFHRKKKDIQILNDKNAFSIPSRFCLVLRKLFFGLISQDTQPQNQNQNDILQMKIPMPRSIFTTNETFHSKLPRRTISWNIFYNNKPLTERFCGCVMVGFIATT